MIEYFIAKRIHFQQGKKNVSRPAVRIAIIGMALGLAVMLISIAVITGFKTEIRNKIVGFGGHIQITNFDNNQTFEMNPIRMEQSLIDRILTIDGVRHVQKFITKPGIIRTDTEFQGMVLKGVGEDFDWDFFESNLVEGTILDAEADDLQVIISTHLANLLELELGDRFSSYFLQEPVLTRRFRIVGLYSTNFVEFDRIFLLTDIRHLRRLNAWDDDQFSGLEVLIYNFNRLDALGDEISLLTSNRFNEYGGTFLTRTIKQLNPQIFGWLELIDMNVWVILTLMLAVAGFIMISGLLILILERTNMIGVLKSLGMTNWSIRKIFLYHSFFLILKGMIWGNFIGLTICALQYFFHFFPLDPEMYYVATVPIYFNWLFIILLNIGTLIASLLMMIGPSFLITKISPVEIIRYE